MPTVTPPAVSATKTKRVCDWLVRDKLLKPEQTEAVFTQVQRSGDRVEEVILELGLVSEANMLKSLSAQYQVYFVSSEKLAKADVARALLDMIPQRFAEKIGVCPVVFDAKTHVLTVITADPEDLEALREAQLASGAREVKAVLARPAAIRALIAKAYGGDIHAFALLDRQAHAQLQSMLEVYDRNVVSDGAMTASVARAEAKGRTRERVLSEKELARAGTAATSPNAVGSSAQFLELLNVLVSLLESSRPDLRGHSSQVARLARLAGSIAAGHTGELKLDFYRDGLRLVLAAGRLAKVETWQPPANEDGNAAFPGLTFLQLLFGYRALDELTHAFPDCRCHGDEARELLKALFPKQASNVWPIS